MIAAENNNATNEKTKELLLYIAKKLKEHDTYGATILNKALYFIDCISYINTQKPVSNLRYIKQDYGPTPKPAQFLALKGLLVQNGEAEEVQTSYFGLMQKKLMPLRDADLQYFTKEEIVMIDEVLSAISNHNGSTISHFTHNFIAWQIANTRDELPLNSFILTSKIPTESDIAWANDKVSKYLT